MTTDPRRKTMRKNSCKVIGRNANSVVRDDQSNAAFRRRFNTERHSLVVAPTIVGGILRIPDQIDEDLKHF